MMKFIYLNDNLEGRILATETALLELLGIDNKDKHISIEDKVRGKQIEIIQSELLKLVSYFLLSNRVQLLIYVVVIR